jgi:hypothetical protein
MSRKQLVRVLPVIICTMVGVAPSSGAAVPGDRGATESGAAACGCSCADQCGNQCCCSPKSTRHPAALSDVGQSPDPGVLTAPIGAVRPRAIPVIQSCPPYCGGGSGEETGIPGQAPAILNCNSEATCLLVNWLDDPISLGDCVRFTWSLLRPPRG